MADVVVTIWREIDAALTPILGARGSALLYQRNLHRTAAVYPWLAEAFGGAHSAMDLPGLHSALAHHAPATVALVGSELLSGFRNQLAGLIGPSLTDCLLRSAWTLCQRDMPIQDSTLP